MPERAPSARRGRAWAVALLATALTAACVTAASADHGEAPTGENEVGTLGAQNTGGTLSTDTELTPVGKDGAAAGWQQIAGSLWRPDGTITDMARPSPGQDSPTPYDLDFYGVGFLKVDVAITNDFSREAAGIEAQTNGFAVGAQCRREDPAQPVPAEDVEGCERVPVIYRYYEHPTKGLIWEESYPGSDDKATDPGGFVAAVTWLTPDRALAVGGTGEYPRREQELTEGQIATCEREAEEAERAALWGEKPNPLDEEEEGKEGWADDPEGETEVEFGSGRTQQFTPDRISANGVVEYGGLSNTKRGVYERALEECASRARVHNDLESGAGAARAWLYTQDPATKVGSWRELRNLPDGEDGDEIPDAMRALHALDASPRPKDCGAQFTSECAIAGGMRQLWHFADGEFRQGFGPELNGGAGMTCSPIATCVASIFRFRVRDVRFAPNWRLSDGQVQPRSSADPPATHAVALTSGCCTTDRARDFPAQLWLGGAGWNATSRAPLLGVSTALDQRNISNPDSYYALMFHDAGFSALRTPGGPSARYGSREPPSRFTGPGLGCDFERCTIERTVQPSGTGTSPAPGTTLSSLRLVSADGDVRGFFSDLVPDWSRTDGIADWAVGVLRSSGRGVAYNTAFGANRAGDLPCGLGVPCTTLPYLVNPQQCVGDEQLIASAEDQPSLCSFEAYQRKNASQALYALPSYALNAYRVAGEDPFAGQEGAGWAVGDHGAIVTRGGGVAGAEAPPARRGQRAAAEPVPGAGAFDPHREAPTDEPGLVPAQSPGAVPVELGFTDGQYPFGSVRADLIAMSRDGSEGWAYGSSASTNVFYHYDGLRWAPCTTTGPGEPSPPDPCAGAPTDAVSALARVPLERDADPTNDDEFEAVALTGSGLHRYREGRWFLDEDATYTDAGTKQSVTGVGVAFTSPDDGWVVSHARKVPTNLSLIPQTWLNVLHFDGTRWVSCTPLKATGAPDDDAPIPEECGDPDPERRRLRIQTPCEVNTTAGLASAGERVYLYSVREVGRDSSTDRNPCHTANAALRGELHPVILHHDRGGTWRGGTDPDLSDGYNPSDGGWDPGCMKGFGAECVATGDAEHRGRIAALSVARDADGSFAGWATGTFGGLDKDADALMMRLAGGGEAPGAEAWRPWTVRDAADDYLRYPGTSLGSPEQLLALPSEAGRRSAFLFLSGEIGTLFRGSRTVGRAPALAFDRERGRWVAIPTPWTVSLDSRDGRSGQVEAVAPDGRRGFWAAVSIGAGPVGSFHHYTDRAPRPVFEETADPTAGKSGITAFGAGVDGTVWLGDERGSVYRYDRLAGWSPAIRIPGWDPARVTRRAPVNAIAVGPDGSGVAVGDGGRIATLGERVQLDPAATIACDPQAIVPPCGRGSDLLAAAVAPDGSAIVAGARRTLLWRPADGGFRPIAEPPVPLATSIVKVQMPRPDRAYLLTGDGARVIRGDMIAPGRWVWRRGEDGRFEIGDPQGFADPLLGGAFARVNDIAIDADGHGYAVGSDGLVLERSGDGERPWRRVPSGTGEELRAVALPAGRGEGALVGGARILTLIGDRFEVARHADPFDPLLLGGIVGLALTPGFAEGEVEAWVVRGRGLLHHPAEPGDLRLDPSRGLAPLPDVPEPSAGELSFAAFGKQDCAAPRGFDPFGVQCGPPDGANFTTDLINRRIREELAARSAERGAPRFALFTGDAVDAPGDTETLRAHRTWLRTPLGANLKHRRWVELVADPLAERGVPVFGAIGGHDLARNAQFCTTEPQIVPFHGNCSAPLQLSADQVGAHAGLNLPWRAAMDSLPAPWEREQQAGGLRFERLGAGALSQKGPDAKTDDLGVGVSDLGVGVSGFSTTEGVKVAGFDLDAGDTHYAVDVIDEATDEKVARIVVVDTSMRSIAASDPQQHPIEAGGQLRWLEEVLCFEGSAEDTDGDVRDCTREPGQQAVVLSNTPTYSYGPISPEETQTDAAAFEAILLKNQVNVVVSGRLGWNGRYWAIAPGVHAPCPGQGYRSDDEAPSIGQPEICGASSVGGTQGVVPDPNQVIDELPEDAKQAAGLAGRGAIPFVVSSTAGGRFNEKAVRGGFATAESGFWRGYSIVRLHPSGDPAKTIVEQRPILDWVGLSAHDPSVAPGQKLQLESFAREAFGMDTAPRYYEIPATQAITHRYHLLLAHPDEPWRACEVSDSECEAYYSKLAVGPRSLGSARDDKEGARGAAGEGGASASAIPADPATENPCDPYLCLPERVGTIDADTGAVRAGNGKYPDTFALATLSVGEHVAVQPLVFTKSASFVLSAFGQPPEVPAPGANVANAPTAPPPPPTPKPPAPQVNTPEPPLPPAVPPIAATQPPEPQPPAPPAPPPPTEQPSPLNLTLAPPSIAIATPTAVIQPPTPPVNPAPPGGARREARQRQAAAQKSGADNDEASSEGESHQGDHTRASAGDLGMSRRDRTRPEPSFTALARADQPSAWAQGALYTGALALMAAALAAGWSRGRPTPRSRPPEVPAPAWNRARNRH